MLTGRFIRVAAFAALTNPLFLISAAHAQWTLTILTPPVTNRSIAYDVSGRQQVGEFALDGRSRASLWSGTADSWLDLTPTGSEASRAFAVGGGQQVGEVWTGGVGRASLWSGTAGSWVDLSPVGATHSRAQGMGGGQQVGYAFVNDELRASLWSGSGASWVDLSVYLPEDYIQSEAFGISSDGVNTYIVGFGVRPGGTHDAWMLTRPVPEPETWLLMLIGAGWVARQARRPNRPAGPAGAWRLGAGYAVHRITPEDACTARLR